MKKTLSKLKLTVLALAAGVGLLAALPQPAKAMDSFNITNVIVSNVLIQSWPTNNISTNGLTESGFLTYPGVLTGSYVDCDNYTTIGFEFRGVIISIGQPGTNYITLVRSGSHAPTFTYTNANTVSYATLPYGKIPFETTPQMTISVPYLAGTNYIDFITNLPNTYVQAAREIGVYSITNFGTAGSYWTNCECGLIRNITPTALTGGNVYNDTQQPRFDGSAQLLVPCEASTEDWRSALDSRGWVYLPDGQLARREPVARDLAWNDGN